MITLAATVLGVSCGDDDNAGDTRSGASTAGVAETATDGDGASMPTATTVPGADPAPSTEPLPATDSPSFAEIFDGDDRPFYARYRTVDQDGAETALVWISDPPRGVIGDDISRTFILDDGVYNCDLGTATCEPYPPEAADSISAQSLGGILSIGPELLLAAEQYDAITSTGTEEIAGRTATCVTFDGAKAGFEGDGTACVDTELGLLLRWADDSSTTEAIEVREPTDADFTLPG